MNFPVPTVSLPPPRLTMDEYADCIQYLLDATDPARARAQKEYEERIEVPFSLRTPGGSQEDGGRAAGPGGRTQTPGGAGEGWNGRGDPANGPRGRGPSRSIAREREGLRVPGSRGF